ncbi:Cellulase protein [Dioscorea alata]|uniref:Cellulase protein n=1 Tax=Dioscorea alata TaxID=55571 RepID=A0ACB7W2Q2_DIOAL|nr:Cellulase protein [Dioscorea alata]
MKFFNILLLPLVFLSPTFRICNHQASALPLSTDGRWIINEDGRRVKLACVNWPGHVDTMVIEGLNKQPVDAITAKISSLGFNCVRLTYAIYMLTNETSNNITVRESLHSNGLNESVAAISVHNPEIIDLLLIDAFKAVVDSLSRNNVMVILDNHISKPEWCCGREDGNGFFGDLYFNPDEWIKGLTEMATKFNGVTNVIGMSLRNELRGPRENTIDWFKYMQRGAEAVHEANKNVIVIMSGLNFDTDLTFLINQTVNLSFKGKHAFEVHWYSFSNPGEWNSGNPNQVCRRIAGNVMRKAGFLLGQGFPLFMSEFGIDQRGVNIEDNRYFPCVLSVLAKLDMDWALWTLQGSYYTRQGQIGTDETYSVLSYDWVSVRNQTFLTVLSSLQSPLRGPGIEEVTRYKMIYHPLTGKCVLIANVGNPVTLGPCNKTEAWFYNEVELALMKGSLTFCIEAYGDGQAAKLGIICGGPSSKWTMISSSMMQLSSQLVTSGNNTLCLDVGSDGRTLVTNQCLCLDGSPKCDPESQWFKLVTSTRKTISMNS